VFAAEGGHDPTVVPAPSRGGRKRSLLAAFLSEKRAVGSGPSPECLAAAVRTIPFVLAPPQGARLVWRRQDHGIPLTAGCTLTGGAGVAEVRSRSSQART
jgi:hypothetical protein